MREERCRGEAGQAGGIEAIPFGLLVFVMGGLLVANVWGVIDTKATVTSAAREATRAYVEAASAGDGDAAAGSAARAAARGGGRDPDRLELERRGDAGFARCTRVTYEARYPVPAIRLPWFGGFGRGFTASATHSEIIDPYRSGLAGTAACRGPS